MVKEFIYGFKEENMLVSFKFIYNFGFLPGIYFYKLIHSKSSLINNNIKIFLLLEITIYFNLNF
jgi:hypothetical protein